ncbi:MAG: hypothetical protein AAB300_03550 [Nitrospirota bacterium]
MRDYPLHFLIFVFVAFLSGFSDVESAWGREDQPLKPLPRRPSSVTSEPASPIEAPQDADFSPLTDRWRITPPPYEINVKGSLWDPYNQNILKGDLPIYGQDIFLSLTGTFDYTFELRTLPTPSGVSAERSGSVGVFGNDRQSFINQNFILSVDLFKGDTAFKPFDWRIKATFIDNINKLYVEEKGIVNIDVRRRIDRKDDYFALQELFLEVKLADLSPRYDFVSIRGGFQPLNTDFRGFIYNDTNLGIRLFGNHQANRNQYNIAFFDQREKDTNSGLNTFDSRGLRFIVANFYRQDFIVKGFTTQISLHQLWDDRRLGTDINGSSFQIGAFDQPHKVDATYFGWVGSGHIGRLNIEHALYAVEGDDTFNDIAGREVDISAYMGALELSIDKDWLRPKVSYFYASGDDHPRNRKARGFDAIFDNPGFVGGPFSFWNRLGIPLAGSAVPLVNRGSLIPNLRSKERSQGNFVNPGIHIINVGLDVEITPKSKGIFNANYLRFDKTQTLELLLFQPGIKEEIGWDVSAGVRYRPFLNNNIILLAGAAFFWPGDGFTKIYESGSPLHLGFTNLILTF